MLSRAELEILLRDGGDAAKRAAILDPANPPDVLEPLLLSRLPAGVAPPEREFWVRPEWWEPAGDIALFLERSDIPPGVFERLAERGLWTLVAGHERAPAALLEQAARSTRDPLVHEELTENRAAPDAAMDLVRREARRRPAEWLLWAALLPLNAAATLAWYPAEALHWLLRALLALVAPITATAGYRPLRRPWFEILPTAAARRRASLRKTLQEREKWRVRGSAAPDSTMVE